MSAPMGEESVYATYPSLNGRGVFITGGATGIGAELVRQFAAQGSRVGFVDIDDEAAADLLTTVARETGTEPWFRRCDIRDVPALQSAVHEAATVIGPVRVLVNNAANDQRQTVENVTVEFWDDKMNVNLRPHFFTTQAVAPMMAASGGGSVVNLGSITWHAKFAHTSVYATAKAAIEGLTRSLARDLGPSSIRVNCLIPGWVMTQRQLRDWVTPQAELELDRAQCLNGRLQPADIARLAMWLTADDSMLCTGQTWVADGGWI